MNKINCNKSENSEIEVQVSELILTPLTCSMIINEVIKCLLYQKSQIPYPYSWLKSVVNKKRTAPNVPPKFSNLQAERHFLLVSAAYDSLEKLMNSISVELSKNGGNISRILLIFGSSIHAAKEIYTFNLSGLAVGHLEKNHLCFNSKRQHQVIRDIIFSEGWLEAMNLSIPLTNMFVLIEKCDTKLEEQKTDFQLTKQYSMCSSIKNICINLSYNSNIKHNCCSNLLIFEDLRNSTGQSNTEDNVNNLTGKKQWFQSKTVVQGFSKCFIDGVSATEIW